jgi:hypothetical protein
MTNCHRLKKQNNHTYLSQMSLRAWKRISTYTQLQYVHTKNEYRSSGWGWLDLVTFPEHLQNKCILLLKDTGREISIQAV